MVPSKLVSVGVAAMDAQHKLLYDLVEKAALCVNSTSEPHLLMKFAFEFRATLETHFSSEERALEKHEFKNIDKHKLRHREILKSIDDRISALDLVKTTTARFAIISEIEDCLYAHEIVDDSEYCNVFSETADNHIWDESLSLGVEWIDEQHKALFGMINVLMAHLRNDEWTTAQFIFERILAHVRRHFDDEELYIKYLGASALDHRRQHLHALLALEESWHESDQERLRHMDLFIADWLRSHITVDDRRDVLAPKEARENLVGSEDCELEFSSLSALRQV
jgi:hemerythrin